MKFKNILALWAHLTFLPSGLLGLNFADVPCGQMNQRHFPRIMGGKVTDITGFSYAISLRKDGEHYCGGSLINRQFVLTAAHCVNGFVLDRWTITVGEQNRAIPETHEQTFTAAGIVMHKNYTMKKSANDIALVRLSGPVEWNEHAQPACLPDPDDTSFAGKQGLMAGWGSDSDGPGDHKTEDLNFANLPILENSKCQELFDEYNVANKKHIKIIDEQFCAGHLEGKIDGCLGDSGSGLAVQTNEGMVVAGIMSSGIGCGLPRLPGVYTNVHSYVRWINETITNWDDSIRTGRQIDWTGIDSEHKLLRLKRKIEFPMANRKLSTELETF